MRNLLRACLGVVLGCTSLWAAPDDTQTLTLKGTVTPGNDQNYCVFLFDANGTFSADYLPVEQEAGENSFTENVTVPIPASGTEVATVLSVFGGNGGTNDSPVSVVLNAAAAASTSVANGADGPTVFAMTFPGKTEVNIFNDLEDGNFTDLERFMGANLSKFVTLDSGYAAGNVVAISQPNPGAATFDLVPEPGTSWLVLLGAGAALVAWPLRRRS